MKTETISRILLTIIVLAILSGIGYFWVNGRVFIFIIGVAVAVAALWWIWSSSKKLKPS